MVSIIPDNQQAVNHRYNEILETSPCSTVRFNKRYVTEANLDLFNRVSIIKSPMGSGKTQLVKELIEEFDSLYGHPPKVLYMVHRRSLANNAAERLGISCYMHLDGDLTDVDQLVCTPNSSQRIINPCMKALPEYDILVIDEIEQFLRHLFGSTMSGISSKNAFNILNNLIKYTPTVICLDAYAGTTALHYIQTQCEDVTFYQNMYHHKKGRMKLFEKKDQVMRCLSNYLHAAKRKTPTALLCDRKSEAEAVYKVLEADGHEVLLVTADTSDEEDVKKFIDNPNDGMGKYDLIIASPLLGTGISIESEVDRIFAIFAGNVIPPDEMMQFLGRFRKARYAYVYLPKILNGERTTDTSELYNTCYEQSQKTWLEIRYTDNQQLELTQCQHEFLELYSIMQAEVNKAMNITYGNFWNLASERYDMITISDDGEHAFDEDLKEARKLNREEKKDQIMTAQPISEGIYREYEYDRSAIRIIKYGYERWLIEQTYGMEITEETYEHWKGGKGKKRLLQFMSAFRPERFAIGKDTEEYQEKIPVQSLGHHKRKRKLIRQALSIVFGDELHWREISEDNLYDSFENEFTPFIYNNATDIRKLFNYRGDLSDPLNILRHLMRHLGLKFERKRKGSKKERLVYLLSYDSLDQMCRFATSHAKYHSKEWDTDLALSD